MSNVSRVPLKSRKLIIENDVGTCTPEWLYEKKIKAMNHESLKFQNSTNNKYNNSY